MGSHSTSTPWARKAAIDARMSGVQRRDVSAGVLGHAGKSERGLLASLRWKGESEHEVKFGKKLWHGRREESERQVSPETRKGERERGEAGRTGQDNEEEDGVSEGEIVRELFAWRDRRRKVVE